MRLKLSAQLAHQYLDCPLIPSDELSYQDLVRCISQQVNDYLNHDFQGLLNALYRIDVDESKFKAALSCSKPDEVADTIARLILDRIILKVETRLKYST